MFQIGELAKKCQVSADTLRFYEKTQLLKPAGRSESGYRLYNEENQRQVNFILKAKELGLSLEDIKELLGIQLEPTEHSCAEVKLITFSKLATIDSKIIELTRIRVALKKINDACCGDVTDSAEHCSILAALEQQEQEQDKESACCSNK